MKKGVISALVILGLMLGETYGKRLPSFAGPWRAIIRTINNETDEFQSKGKLWVRLYPSSPKPKQPQYYRGKIYGGMEIGDDIKVAVRVSKRSNNQWKRNAFVLHFDRACSDILFHVRSVAIVLYGTSNLKCPLPQVNYREIKNQSMEIVFPQFPTLPYGRWLFTMAFIKGTDVVGVIAVDGDLVPKL